jgi:small basic protein (TIGR04137 family)
MLDTRSLRGFRQGYLFKFMSQHRSLRAASTSGAKRNVLKRYERVEILKKRNQWKTGDRVTGLRKTKPSE